MVSIKQQISRMSWYPETFIRGTVIALFSRLSVVIFLFPMLMCTNNVYIYL